tara:strand:- start:529 stop:816 length:288 start_codon:yes stop_codon:yes gene_type:complete
MSAASFSLAHESHEHAAPLDQTTAVTTADTKIKELIDEGKLTSKWAAKALATAELVRVDGIQNWVVSYTDEDKKERLQLIFTTTGEYVSMNQSNV